MVTDIGGFMMKSGWLSTIFVIFVSLSMNIGVAQTHEDGMVIVRVLIGDDNTPARDASVYVQGYFRNPSRSVKAARPGWFEISLPPGIYDIYVGELSSLPKSKRVE